MSKMEYSIFYFFTILFIVYSMIKCIRSKSNLKYKCFFVMLIAAVTNSFYLGYLFGNTKLAMSISMSLVFMGFTWLLFFFLGFMYSYTGHVRKKIPSTILFGLVIVNNIIMIVNIFTEFALSYNPVYINGDMYVRFVYHWPYAFHLVLNYTQILLAILCLVVRGIQVPKVYKIKYFSILSCIFVIIIINSFFLYSDLLIDYSLVAYSIFAIFIYHFVLNFTPRHLAQKIQELVIDAMTDAVLVYDTYGNYFYANKNALSLFGEEIKNTTIVSFKQEYSELSKNTDEPVEVTFGNEKLAIEVEGCPFIDSDGKIQAYYYVFHNVTFRVEQMKLRKYQSTHDELTKIFNRRHFFEASKKMVDDIKDDYFVIATNFKRFRLVNDIFGAEVGNKLLIDTGQIIKKISDELDLVYGRMDSDKFAILVTKNMLEENKLIERLTDEITILVNTLPLELKIGVCEITEDDVEKAYDKAIMTIHYINTNYSQQIGYYTTEVKNKLLKEQNCYQI